jgi:hypothetical protein
MKMKIDMKKEIGIESKDCKRLEKFMSKLFNFAPKESLPYRRGMNWAG